MNSRFSFLMNECFFCEWQVHQFFLFVQCYQVLKAKLWRPLFAGHGQVLSASYVWIIFIALLFNRIPAATEIREHQLKYTWVVCNFNFFQTVYQLHSKHAFLPGNFLKGLILMNQWPMRKPMTNEKTNDQWESATKNIH